MLNSILFYFLLLFFPSRGLTPLGVEIQRWWQARDNSISLQPLLVKVQFPCLQTAEDPLPAVQPPAGPLPRDTVQHPKGCHHTGKSWHLLHWIEDNVYPNFSLRNDYKILGNANVWKPMFFCTANFNGGWNMGDKLKTYNLSNVLISEMQDNARSVLWGL